MWYDNNPDPSLEKVIKKLIRRNEPIFLFRYGYGEIPLPQGYYWRVMEELDEKMRVYQLEVEK
ncbi:MAG: hypothetical protein HC836_42640 [Richelia sp. RM2_1_2]|nr:hypothetical protein [Richelia sp. RM2_1_2]